MNSREAILKLHAGIRLKRDNLLVVQTRKRMIVDGQEVKDSAYDTVSILDNSDTSFKKSLQEAIEIKAKHLEQLTSANYHSRKNGKKVITHGTLKDCLEMTYTKQWEGKGNETNIKIYIRDILNYFSPDIKLEDMQTDGYYNGFIKYMEKTIIERPNNNLATFNTRTTNHRLSVLRETFREAISKRMLEQSKLLNADLRIRDMGWSNLRVIKSKSKKPISREDEIKVIDLAYANNDEEHADAMQYLINGLGQRLQFEFYDAKFTIDCIDYKNKTINFFRHKTQQWSGDLPLNDIAYRICVKYRETAIAHKSRKLFPNVTVRSMRTFFEKYGKILEIKDFTPYSTKHTFITRLCETKTPVKVISKLAGISIETVLKYYAQETPEALREAVNSINDSNVISLIGHNSKGLIK